MKDLTTGNKVAIGVIAAVVAALIVLFAVFHRGVFLVLAIVTAVIAVLFTVTAYAAGLFNQRFTKASGAVSGEWIWHNDDGTVEV